MGSTFLRGLVAKALTPGGQPFSAVPNRPVLSYLGHGQVPEHHEGALLLWVPYTQLLRGPDVIGKNKSDSVLDLFNFNFNHMRPIQLPDQSLP